MSAGADAPPARRTRTAAPAPGPEAGPTTRYERADGEVLTRATIYLPQALHRRLKARCAEQGRDVSSVVSELVMAWIDHKGS